ncbi:diguanylate cyclase/phosphodiesterase (GGDEF & EAL domains) with PAS/PAC sensor(s) [hydrothermal vent metagenome]|uniref:Diguanylate cyclase/phosphodiesterase (GGDEF & EAL domains) with PAS/PAC sensor(S) n=1 Tax=hydrothermal vent metagenome TaxID=652676 RepID=A0A3B1BN68_9ZZZZ
MLFSSYRSKLLVYTIAMMVLLAGSLLYTYRYVRNILLEEDDLHADIMATIFHNQLEAEKTEYQRYADIVAEDLRIKEHMFALVRKGSDSLPLKDTYNRHFGWLPINRYVVVSQDKRKILVGQEHADLDRVVLDILEDNSRGTFYSYGDYGLELIAVSAIVFHGRRLGSIAVSYFMDEAWLLKHKKNSGGDLFFTQDGIILGSSTAKYIGQPFRIKQDRVVFGKNIFFVRPVQLSSAYGSIPKVWFGLPQTLLLKRLEKHRLTTMGIILASLSIILFLGVSIMRNFTQPLSQLVKLTREVAEGSLPRLDKSAEKNEISELSNQFADMLQALREQQEEIQMVHAELEKSAITDSLTGLYNRHYLNDTFPKLMAQAGRGSLRLYALLIDLDNFKNINDTYGHICGDQCLQQFAASLMQVSRANDYLFRMGGEEFLVLALSDDTKGIVALGEKIRRAIENLEVSCNDQIIHFTISCGISYAQTEESLEENINTMLSLADAALYRAKEEGRNRVRVDEHIQL